jgi:hypothetical protein
MLVPAHPEETKRTGQAMVCKTNIKWCNGCQRYLAHWDFYERSQNLDGLDFRCINCRRSQSKAQVPPSKSSQNPVYNRLMAKARRMELTAEKHLADVEALRERQRLTNPDAPFYDGRVPFIYDKLREAKQLRKKAKEFKLSALGKSDARKDQP